MLRSPDRIAEVAALTQEHQALFRSEGVAAFEKAGGLGIPPDQYNLFKYMVIPPALLELPQVENPRNVQLLPTTWMGEFSAYVVERRDRPVTPIERLAKYHQEHPRMIVLDGETDIDPYALEAYRLSLENKPSPFSVNDYVLLEISLQLHQGDGFAFIEGWKYWDREALRRMGVGRSYFARLAEAANYLGINALIGERNGNNLDTFHRLGTISLNQVSAPIRRHFAEAQIDSGNRMAGHYLTVYPTSDRDRLQMQGPFGYAQYKLRQAFSPRARA